MMYQVRVVMSALILLLSSNLVPAEPINPNSLWVKLGYAHFPASCQLFNLCRFNESVQKEIQMTEKERAALEKCVLGYNGAERAKPIGGKFAPNKGVTRDNLFKDLVKILGKTRAQRVQEIDWQRTRTRQQLFHRLNYDSHLNKLLLTNAQQEKLKNAQTQIHQRMSDMERQPAGKAVSLKEWREAQEKFIRQAKKQMEDSVPQKVYERFETLKGEKFKGKLYNDFSRTALGGQVVG